MVSDWLNGLGVNRVQWMAVTFLSWQRILFECFDLLHFGSVELLDAVAQLLMPFFLCDHYYNRRQFSWPVNTHSPFNDIATLIPNYSEMLLRGHPGNKKPDGLPTNGWWWLIICESWWLGLPSVPGRMSFSTVSVGFSAVLSKDSTPIRRFCCVFSSFTSTHETGFNQINYTVDSISFRWILFIECVYDLHIM